MKISNVVLVAVCLFHLGAECEATFCDEDYHVVNNVCVACPSGQSNLAGDDSSGQDTSCDTCRITTNQELRDHVDSWIADPSNHPCGEVIGDWEVGRVTDMSYVFCGHRWLSSICNANRADFNADISKWNTASVTDLAFTFWFLRDIVEAMIYLHDKEKSVHGDLKCQNVLVKKEKGLLRAKVADFGTSRFMKQRSTSITNELETKDSDSRARTVSTTATTVASLAKSLTKDTYNTMTSKRGTPLYMAPEQHRALKEKKQVARFSNKIDVYAFSMIMNEMLTRRVVWHQFNQNFTTVIAKRVMNGRRPEFVQMKLKDYPKDFPMGYYALMKSCWDQEPEKRPSFSEILKRVSMGKSKWVDACTDDDDDQDRNEEKEEEKENDREAVQVTIQEEEEEVKLADSDSDEEVKYDIF